MNSDQPIRIAFCGPAGSGKTTHARLMQQVTGGDVLSFASPLKKVVKDLFGDLPEEQQREANQRIGLVARSIDQNIWVKKLLAKVSPNRPTYTDDCRFYNEVQALRAHGFLIIRVDAPYELLLERRPGMTLAQRQHQSEIELATIRADFTIMTDQPEADAHTQILDGIFNLRPEWTRKRKVLHVVGGNQ